MPVALAAALLGIPETGLSPYSARGHDDESVDHRTPPLESRRFSGLGVGTPGSKTPVCYRIERHDKAARCWYSEDVTPKLLKVGALKESEQYARRNHEY